MATQKPQEISVEIVNQLRHFALSGGRHSAVSQHMQSILDECDKLARVNAIDASLLKANLYAIAGDGDKCDYWLRNAERIGGGDQIPIARCSCMVLLGNISEAYAAFEKAGDGTASSFIVMLISSCGMFRKALEILNRTKLDVDPSLVENINKAVRFVDHLKLSDEKICRVMDVVLGFLCERGLIWLGSTPDYRFLPAESGGPLLSLTYRLDVSHEAAAGLNVEMIDRLVAADLDSCGLIASLQGTMSKASQAVALA